MPTWLRLSLSQANINVDLAHDCVKMLGVSDGPADDLGNKPWFSFNKG